MSPRAHRMVGDANDDSGGPGVEKWLFRALLLVAIGALAAAVLSSMDDIKRYRRIRNM